VTDAGRLLTPTEARMIRTQAAIYARRSDVVAERYVADVTALLADNAALRAALGALVGALPTCVRWILRADVADDHACGAPATRYANDELLCDAHAAEDGYGRTPLSRALEAARALLGEVR